MTPKETNHVETWETLPEHDNYEVSSLGRVRSFKGRAQEPKILRGKSWHGERYYTIDGTEYPIGDLMTATFGADQALATLADQRRPLTEYERAEILDLEGIRPAHAVAEEFRIDMARVRELWNGTGD